MTQHLGNTVDEAIKDTAGWINLESARRNNIIIPNLPINNIHHHFY